jgi:hypothetical protein
LKKKGFYFTLDAIFATVLIGTALALLSFYFITDTTYPQINYYSQDIVSALSNIRLSELNDTYVQQLIADGTITNENNSIIEQIGEFYVLNKTELANNLTKLVSDKLIPSKFGFEILINNESIYTNGTSERSELVSTRRLISGIEKDRPIRGSTSKVYLESIKSKSFFTYLYFGGFIGQGNITGFIDDVPDTSNISQIYVEMDAGFDFSIKINDIVCSSNLSVGTGSMTADAWDISYCNSSIVPGAQNNFSIQFLGDLDSAYIGGGFIKIAYQTNKLQTESNNGTIIEYLPGIEGIVNLYSSFNVPGTLNNITVYLHYNIGEINETNNTFYLTIANQTIFRDNNFSGEKNQTLTVLNITEFLTLASMDRKTVPIRIGFENATFGYIYEGNADVALITDVSGSMDDQMGSTSTGTLRNCDDSNYNLSTTRRISVAKCLDVDFADQIINITGNKVGLISYEASTDTSDTVYPTTSLTSIENTIGTSVPETGYNAGGYTCICCGINSARDILVENITTIDLISSGSSWLYNNFTINGDIKLDSVNNSWYNVNYENESQWFSGNAILGSTNGYSYSPTVDTEMGSDLSGNTLYANLWENAGDTVGAPNDFSSNILNYTANTFGIGAGDDGWDYASGVYDYANSVTFNEVSSQRLDIFTKDNNNQVSGAYGIEVNITGAMYDIINSDSGKITLSFNYRWDESGKFEGYEDQVWIKGRWTSPTSGEHYLGSDLDSGTSDPDATFEIDVENDPDADITNGYHSQELQSWVEDSGMYYLDLGGKLLRDSTNEEGYFRFDNIMIEITNSTDYYYFRKNFTVNIDEMGIGVLNVLSDDYAKVYLNGELVDLDTTVHEAEYWNRRGKNIQVDKFVDGTNVLAVEVQNMDEAMKFDLELINVNSSRSRAMMVMTDGNANRQCGEQSTGSSSGDAIQAACDARENYGITVYAVGFSDDADEITLQGIADCGDGVYVKSNNITVLEEFYADVASSIVSASRRSQTIEIEGNLTSSLLYGDSYIEIEYTPIASAPSFGEIAIIREEKNFDNCTFEVYIPDDVRVTDAKLTSYSSEHWTDAVLVNDNEIYNLTTYSEDYGPMGDPFLVNVPVDDLVTGNNTFFVRTGDSGENFTGCSLNNSFIYESQVTASVSYSDVLEKAEGCNWQIEFDNLGSTIVDVPQGYSGTKNCFYTNALIDYDQNDTYDDAMFKLLDNLDFDNDGRIYVDLEEKNFVIGAISVGKISYPWGPAIAEVRVWK